VIGRELAGDATFVKRFEQEAVITRKLQHPNAVRVDDIDEAEDGRPFIVMEFIDGTSLKKLIRSQSPLPVSRVCSIIKQAASALDAAHRLGMVHRDIKPDNIMLVETPAGELAKVLDFGIAKIKEARLSGETSGMTLTGTGLFVGTPQYMSPEQAAGKRGGELDSRSDIYALGIVAYQMLTGELPYKADTTMEILLAHMQAPPTPIRTIRPNLQIPGPIADAVMRCLEKKLELRSPSAQALIEELERAERVATMAVSDAPRRGKKLFGPSAQSPTAPAEARQPQQHVSLTERRGPSPATSPRSGRWAATSIAVLVLAAGVWYFAGGKPQPTPVQPARVRPVDVLAPTPARKQAAASTDESVISPTADRAAQPGLGEGPRQTAPATNGRGAAGSGSKAVGAADATPAATKSNALEIEKRVKGAVTEGDFHYNNGAYDEAIKSYREGLKIDGASAELRQKIQRAQKAKAAEGAVKQ